MTSALLYPSSAHVAESEAYCLSCVVERGGSLQEQERALVLAGDISTVGAAPFSGLCPCHEGKRIEAVRAAEQARRDESDAAEKREAVAFAAEGAHIDGCRKDARRDDFLRSVGRTR